MDWLYQKLLTGAIRKGLVALTVYLVSSGYLDAKDQPEALKQVEQFAPAVAAFAWDAYEKTRDAKHRNDAITASGLSPGALNAAAANTPATGVH